MLDGEFNSLTFAPLAVVEVRAAGWRVCFSAPLAADFRPVPEAASRPDQYIT